MTTRMKTWQSVVDDNTMPTYEVNREEGEERGEPDLTVAETAKYLGRSIEQVRRYLRDGALLGYRAGQQWFVPATAAATFKANRVETREMKERKQVLREIQALRAALVAKYGYLDVADWVQAAREGLR